MYSVSNPISDSLRTKFVNEFNKHTVRWYNNHLDKLSELLEKYGISSWQFRIIFADRKDISSLMCGLFSIRWRRIAEKFNAGASIEELAQMYGLNPDSVRSSLTSAGVIPKRASATGRGKTEKSRREPISFDVLDAKFHNQIIRDYIDGLSSLKLVEKYQTITDKTISRFDILRILNTIEDSEPYKEFQKTATYKHLVADINSGMSAPRVASRNNVPEHLVQRIMGLKGVKVEYPTLSREQQAEKKESREKIYSEILAEKRKKPDIQTKVLSEEYGVSEATISRIFKENGLVTDYGNLMERDRKISEMAKNGASFREISAEVNLSICRVKAILKRIHERNEVLTDSFYVRERTAHRNQQILDFVKEHPDVRMVDVSEMFNIGVGSIYRILRENGYSSVQSKRKRIIADYFSGLSPIEIGKKYELHMSSVYRILKEVPDSEEFQEFLRQDICRKIVKDSRSEDKIGLLARLSEKYGLPSHLISQILEKAAN